MLGRLDLTNRGDVLTLRDAEGTLVTRISWGDSVPRAEVHIDRDLELDGSVVR